MLIEARKTSRRILNADELAATCNSWSMWRFNASVASTPVKRVQCRVATFTADNLQNAANVRGADVILVVHGSGEVRRA